MVIQRKKLMAWLFYISYFLIMVSDSFTQVRRMNMYLNYIDYLAVAILGIVFLIQSKKYRLKQIVFISLFILMTIVTMFISKDKNILKLVLLILAFKDLDFDRFIKKDFYFKISIIILLAILYFLGLTDNNLVYREGILRNSFGFKHPNNLGLYLMMICLDYYYMHKNNSIIKPVLLSIIVCLLIYKFIDSRTTFIVIIGATILIIINKILKNRVVNNRIVKFVSKNLFLILLIVSIVFVYLYQRGINFTYTLNRLLTGRIYLNSLFLSQYPINFLGHDILTNEKLILDSSYFNILLKYGLICILFFYQVFNHTIKSAYKNKNYIMVIIFIVLLFYGFSESFLYKVSANAFLLYFGKIYNEAK